MFDGIIATISRTHKDMAQKIAECAGQLEDLTNIMKTEPFSGGEYCPKFIVPVQNKKVYLIATQGPFQNPQDITTRIALASSAAKENGASHVTAIITDLPFSRQDRGPNEDPRMAGQPHSTKVQARIFAANGVDRIVTMHLHSKKNIYNAYEEVYQRPAKDVVYDITPDFIAADYLLNHSSLTINDCGKELLFICVDAGSVPFVTDVMKLTDTPKAGLLVFSKKRKTPNKKDEISIETVFSHNDTSVKGKKVIILEDIIDTGGTIATICDWLNNKKPSEIYLYFTHAIFAGQAYLSKQIDLLKTGAKEIVCTNTRPYIAELHDYEFKKLTTVLLMEQIFGDAIVRCCEQNKHPDLTYTELSDVKKLYGIKRSEIHFLEKKEK